MESRITDTWEKYYQAVKALHTQTDYGLSLKDVEVIGFDELESAALGAEALTDAFEEIIPGREGESEELETAVLAAAAIDLAVAAELLTELRWPVEESVEGQVVVPAAVEEGVPDAKELESIAQLLLRADDAFPQGELQLVPSGGALGSDRPELRADEAIADLVGTATPASTAFGVGLVAAATADVVGVGHELLTNGAALQNPLSKFAGINEVIDRVSPTDVRFGHAVRLFRSGVRKLGLLVAGDYLRDAAVHLRLEQIVDVLNSRSKVGDRIVRRASGAATCEREVRSLLRDRRADMSKLDPELSELCRRYGKNMHWARVAARRIKMCAPVLILLGAGVPGSVLILSANAVGLIYSLFSLADRLDSLPDPVDLVPGVLRIVERARSL